MSHAKDPLTDLGKFAVTMFVLMLLVMACYLIPGPCHSDTKPQFTEYIEPLPVDPLPVSDSVTHYRLIDRIARGIIKWKGGQMYFCGELYLMAPPYGPDENSKQNIEAKWFYMKNLTISIATHIVEAAQDAQVNPWGVLGTMAKESSLDRCAFGLYPRKKAYEMGILKSSRLTISHTEKEVLTAINSSKLDKYFSCYDLGGLQVLDKYYEGNSADLLTWEGFYWQVQHMGERAEWHHTDRPWAYWPGTYSPKYDAHVTYLARKMGATREEI